MCLDIGPVPARVILEPTPCHIEDIVDRNDDILVTALPGCGLVDDLQPGISRRRMRRSFMVHEYVFARKGQLDADMNRPAVRLVAMWELEKHPASHNPTVEGLEPRRAFAYFLFENRRHRHVPKRDLHWTCHGTPRFSVLLSSITAIRVPEQQRQKLEGLSVVAPGCGWCTRADREISADCEGFSE
jgi:hypothetical protein